MRKLIVSEFMTLDGVMQAPGTLGTGKRVFANGVHANFKLRSATPYPTGVVGLDYVRE